MTWDDDCNTAEADYAIDADGYLTITTPLTTLKGCEGSETSGVISAVMGADRIYMDEMGGQLELSDTEGNHIALGAHLRRFGTADGPAGSVVDLMGSLIKKRRKRMRKKKHKKMLKRTRWQRRAAGK